VFDSASVISAGRLAVTKLCKNPEKKATFTPVKHKNGNIALVSLCVNKCQNLYTDSPMLSLSSGFFFFYG
jgi:hypothetical protein